MPHLVSVIISTYNSSEFIVETLESVLKQTWSEIELIITDDCSLDDTVQKCDNWINENRQRFTRSLIITSDVNTGVSANANRGLKCAKGDWIKFLGADDTLMEHCIEDNMLWVKSHQEIRVLFSKVNIYSRLFTPETYIYTTQDDTSDPNSIMATGISAESQYKMLLISDRLHYTPSVFLHRETLLSVGGFDERFRLLEDYPLWLNLTRNGNKLNFMNKVTVNYRRHNKAINNVSKSFLINPNYFKLEEFRKVYTYPFLPVDIRFSQRYTWYMSQIFRFRLLNKQVLLSSTLLNVLTVYLNPGRYLIWFNKTLRKELKEDVFYK